MSASAACPKSSPCWNRSTAASLGPHSPHDRREARRDSKGRNSLWPPEAFSPPGLPGLKMPPAGKEGSALSALSRQRAFGPLDSLSASRPGRKHPQAAKRRQGPSPPGREAGGCSSNTSPVSRPGGLGPCVKRAIFRQRRTISRPAPAGRPALPWRAPCWRPWASAGPPFRPARRAPWSGSPPRTPCRRPSWRPSRPGP